MEKVKCTHKPVETDEVSCKFDHFCHVCGDSKAYCQYQIGNECCLCGNEYCSEHVGYEDHINVCSKCARSNNPE